MAQMSDLKYRIHQLLKENIDGKKVDMLVENIELPHMIGVSPIGADHTVSNEVGTLLDPTHSFWNKYEESVTTRTEAYTECETAIRLLKEENVLTMEYPLGQEGDIVYVEVDDIQIDGLECVNCLSTNTKHNKELERVDTVYVETLTISCMDCGITKTFSTTYAER